MTTNTLANSARYGSVIVDARRVYAVTAYSSTFKEYARFILTASSQEEAVDLVINEHLGDKHWALRSFSYVCLTTDAEFFMEV
jgi:hypothetical protein